MRRVFLLGPTAVGKTSLSLALADRLGAEILSLDSVAIYRGLDIGSAKPTETEQSAVPHHLLDLVDPSERFDVARYREHALAAEEEVRSRGRLPLYSGGSLLYFKVLVHGLFQGVEVDEEVTDRLRQEAEECGVAALHRRLKSCDPPSAARIHPNDGKRIVRALAVTEATGRPMSAWQEEWASAAATPLNEKVVVLRRSRESLRERVERRAEKMFEAGLLEETRAVMAHCGFGPTASEAIGYREAVDCLEGRLSQSEAIRSTIQRSRRLLRRQATWLRSFDRLQVVDLERAAHPLQEARNALEG